MRAAEVSRPVPAARLSPATLGRWHAAILGAAILVGAALRFVGLARNSFWADELYAIWEARRPLDVLFEPQLHLQHPPGYRLALHGWLGISLDETWIRLLPALAGVLLIPVMWALARVLWPSRPAAASLTAILVATSPYLLHYSQDATSYSWTSLWVAVSVLLLALAWRANRTSLWLAWGVSMAVAMYSHYFSFFPLLIEGLAVLGLGVAASRRSAVSSRQSAVGTGEILPTADRQLLTETAGRKLLRGALSGLALAIALYLPWLVVLLIEGVSGVYFFPLTVDDQWLHWLPILLAGYPNAGFWHSPAVLTAIWAGLGAACVWAIWRLSKTRGISKLAAVSSGQYLAHAKRQLPTADRQLPAGHWLLAAWGLASFVGPYLFLRVTYPPGSVDPVRFATMAAPALLIGLGALLAAPPAPARLLLLAGWLLIAGMQIQGEHAAPPVQDWRGLMAAVAAEAQPGDVMLAFPALHAGAAAAYYTEPVPVKGGWFVQEGSDPSGAAYWFVPDWHWQGFLDTRAERSTDWTREIAVRTSGARRIWYLAGDAYAGPYAAAPAAEAALRQQGWHGEEAWHQSPLVLKLYTRRGQ